MPEPETVVPLLLDRYRPSQLLARGCSSMVFRARDENLGRDVAVKLFSSGGHEDTTRFRDEVRVLAALRHHGVVSILDAGVDASSPADPRPFLVMELVDGDTLRTILETGQLSTRRIGEAGFEVAETLEYVHARGVIHRDVNARLSGNPGRFGAVAAGSGPAHPRDRSRTVGRAHRMDDAAGPGGPAIRGGCRYRGTRSAPGRQRTRAGLARLRTDSVGRSA